jgi:hypothetical protein
MRSDDSEKVFFELPMVELAPPTHFSAIPAYSTFFGKNRKNRKGYLQRFLSKKVEYAGIDEKWVGGLIRPWGVQKKPFQSHPTSS